MRIRALKSIVYFSNKEVQITSDIVVNMCEQPEDYAVYVSKEDLQKEKYISELNMLFEVDDNWNLSSNRIKDIIICMQRWFRSLQQATRNVIYLDQYVDNDNMVQAMKTMKKAMQKVEFNPFEILFVEFPEAFGTESLEETFNVIDDCKTRYDDYFRWIEEQAIKAIYDLWDKKRKQNLYHTLKEWYDKQGKRSKMGLYDGRMTNFMSCLEGMDVYSDQDVATFDDTQSPSTDIINTVENDPATSDIDDENEEDEETPPEVIAETGKEELKEIGYEDPTDEQGTAFINNSINFVYADKGERSPAFDYKPVLKTTVITINTSHKFYTSFLSKIYSNAEVKTTFELFLASLIQSVRKTDPYQAVQNDRLMTTWYNRLNNYIAEQLNPRDMK